MKQVLLVEDDVLIGSVMRTILETMGLDVCAVETTQAGAVAAALRLRPDFMIVDASLGDGSGFAAMAEILRHMDMPHLFMSGARFLPQLSGAPILQKPFSERRLSAAIKQLLGAVAPG